MIAMSLRKLLLFLLIHCAVSLYESDWSTYGFNNQRNSLNIHSTAINAASASSLVNIWNLNLRNFVVAQAVVALDLDMSSSGSVGHSRELLDKSLLTSFPDTQLKPESAESMVECPAIFGYISYCSGCGQCPDGSLCQACPSGNAKPKLNITSPGTHAFGSISDTTPNQCASGTYVSTRNMAYVGDESGYFYGLDVDVGCIVWTTFVGAVNFTECSDLPMFGVSGAAVLNRTINTVYVVGGNATLYALSMQTGQVQWSLSRIYDSSVLTTYGALMLYDEVLYITCASRCDFGNYFGGVYAVSTRTHQVLNSFFPSKPLLGGGVWGLGGVTLGVGSSPSLYFPTGNALGPVENGFYCEQVVKTGLDLRVTGNTTFPFNHKNEDQDFGSTATLFNTPTEGRSSGCQSTLLSASRKDGLFVVLNADTMQTVQTLQVSDPTLERYIYQAAWDPDSNMLIVPTDLGYKNISHGLIGYQLSSSCQLVQIWNTVFDNPSSPTIVGPTGGRVVVATGTSICYLLDIRTGAILKYKYGPGGMASVGAPVVVDDLILVSNVALSLLSAFRVTPTPSQRPSVAPTTPTVRPSSMSPTTSILPTSAPSTRSPTKPTLVPSKPTAMPNSRTPSLMPTGPRQGMCVPSNGIVTGCSDCQYCPDGSLCNLCHAPSLTPTANPMSPRGPTTQPTNRPTSPTIPPTPRPTKPSIAPTFCPTVLPTRNPSSSQPTANRPGWCPWYNNIHTGCSDCQFCPDGSLCNLCPPTVAPTLSPTTVPTVAPSERQQPTSSPTQKPSSPTVSPSLTPTAPTVTPSLHPSLVPTFSPSESLVPTVPIGPKPGWCPVYNGIKTGCSDCQYCPDGSLCNLCVEPSLLPTSLPTSAAPVTLMPTPLPTRHSNSTSASTTATVISAWISQNQTIFIVIVAVVSVIVCALCVCCLRRSSDDDATWRRKANPGSPMVLDPDVFAPSPSASPHGSLQHSAKDGDNGDFGVLLRRFSNAVLRRKSSAADKGHARKSSLSLFGTTAAEPTRIELFTIAESNELDSPTSPGAKSGNISSSSPLPVVKAYPLPTIAEVSPSTSPVEKKPAQPVQGKQTDRADLVGARQKILDAMARNKAKQASFYSSSDESQL